MYSDSQMIASSPISVVPDWLISRPLSYQGWDVTQAITAARGLTSCTVTTTVQPLLIQGDEQFHAVICRPCWLYVDIDDELPFCYMQQMCIVLSEFFNADVVTYLSCRFLSAWKTWRRAFIQCRQCQLCTDNYWWTFGSGIHWWQKVSQWCQSQHNYHVCVCCWQWNWNDRHFSWPTTLCEWRCLHLQVYVANSTCLPAYSMICVHAWLLHNSGHGIEKSADFYSWLYCVVLKYPLSEEWLLLSKIWDCTKYYSYVHVFKKFSTWHAA